MKNTILEGKNICKVFSQNQRENRVLDNIDIDIYEKDFTVIMGPSGSGKSTLLYALSGMDGVTSGNVIYKGIDICSLSEKKLANLRAKEFGFVFQQSHLVSNLTLLENVLVAGYAGARAEGSKVRKQAEMLLKEMGIWDTRMQLPSEVSGGEAQRTAIARAIINVPNIVWCDEPTGALNKSSSEDALNLLSKMNEKGQSILMVTHDLRAAIRGNRILYLEDGKVVDELRLPRYQKAQERERENMLQNWLLGLQW